MTVRNRVPFMVRSAIALLFAALALLVTPVQALCSGGGVFLAVVSFLVGLLFAGVAFWGRMRTLLRSDDSADSKKGALTAACRAKRILWIWAGFGGAVLVLSLSTRDASSADEAFGMVGFGWLLTGVAALLLESVSYSLEDATGVKTH